MTGVQTCALPISSGCLILLLLACWVNVGGWWIIGGLAITAASMALPWAWWAVWRFYGRHVLPLCMAVLTVWVFFLLAVIWVFAGGSWLFTLADPLAAVAVVLSWAGFAALYWLPAGPWLKAGVIALLVSLATPVFNSLCDLLIEDMGGPTFWEYFSVRHMLIRRAAGDISWVNPLIFQIMLVCAIVVVITGAVVELRRRKKT